MAQKSHSLGVIGYGNMASAILAASADSKTFSKIDVYDVNPDRIALATASGYSTAQSMQDVVRESDIILLAVKPQQFDDVLASISSLTAGKCVLSIAAGVSVESISSRLAPGTFVIRVMPNTPITLRKGATIVAECPYVPEHLRNAALSLFERSGVTVTLPEELINAATGLSGSSPAFFFLMVEAMLDAAVEQDIDRDAALTLAANTMSGAAAMLLESGKSCGELREMVCSPGGTTLAALSEMERLGFSLAIRSGMFACTKRANVLNR